MNRDVFSLIARYWSAAHCAYYRHVCKTWASWLGVPKHKHARIDDFVPYDDGATYLYIMSCRWSCNVVTSLEKYLLAENCCRLYRAMIRTGRFRVPNALRLARILPRFSRPVYEMFELMFKDHFWTILWQMCSEKRKLTAGDLMLYYGTDVEFPDKIASVIEEGATTDTVIRFYEVISTVVELGQKDLDGIQNACNWWIPTEGIKLVRAMKHVSRDVCDRLTSCGQHDSIEEYCNHHTQWKRIKLY